MVILSPWAYLQTRVDPPKHRTPIMENWNSLHVRFTPAFQNGENPEIVIAVGNVKHRLDTADVIPV